MPSTDGIRRGRDWRRQHLTLGERVFATSWLLLGFVLLLGGGLLAVFDRQLRLVGVALLIIGLLVNAVPISPFLRARLRKREKSADPAD